MSGECESRRRSEGECWEREHSTTQKENYRSQEGVMGSYQEDSAESKQQGTKEVFKVCTKEDIMDTNPWEGDFYRIENQTRHWEGVTVSHRRRSIVSYKERYYTTNMDLNKEENTRAWE